MPVKKNVKNPALKKPKMPTRKSKSPEDAARMAAVYAEKMKEWRKAIGEAEAEQI